MNRIMLLVLLLALVSCEADKPVDNNAPVGLLKNNKFYHQALDREYHLFVPAAYSAKPLVILLHGNRSSHDDLIGENNINSPSKLWLTLAEQNDFFVLVPNGSLGNSMARGWNDCRTDALNNPNSDDVDFISQLLSNIRGDYDFDESRVYVSGISNGGHLAFRLAQEIPDQITAFACVASSIAVNSECLESTVPVSALFMNGTDDSILPYEGGEMLANRGLVFSTEESIDYWVRRNGTAKVPILDIVPDLNTSDGTTALKSFFLNGSNGTEVALYKIEGGGHTEPSIQERYTDVFLSLVGNQNGDFEMAEEIWNFFRDKSK